MSVDHGEVVVCVGGGGGKLRCFVLLAEVMQSVQFSDEEPIMVLTGSVLNGVPFKGNF